MQHHTNRQFMYSDTSPGETSIETLLLVILIRTHSFAHFTLEHKYQQYCTIRVKFH